MQITGYASHGLRTVLNTRGASANTVLVQGWCQQFPSHSMGGLIFGNDGALYVSAGEATVKVGEQDHQVVPAWYLLVPRGMPHTITKRGRTPLVLLSVQSGQSCK